MNLKSLPSLLHISLLIMLLPLSSCKENTPVSKPEFPALSFENPDANGGAWKTVIIKSPNDFLIDIPANNDSDEYQRELLESKTIVKQRTYAQDVAINYWASGGVLRWNQIARELVAKYNHPPKDGETPSANKQIGRAHV